MCSQPIVHLDRDGCKARLQLLLTAVVRPRHNQASFPLLCSALSGRVTMNDEAPAEAAALLCCRDNPRGQGANGTGAGGAEALTVSPRPCGKRSGQLDRVGRFAMNWPPLGEPPGCGRCRLGGASGAPLSAQPSSLLLEITLPLRAALLDRATCRDPAGRVPQPLPEGRSPTARSLQW